MIIFDIETEVNQDAVQYISEPVPPKNYKDEEKIAAWIVKKKEEQVERAALDPDFGKIIAIGWCISEGETKPKSVLMGDFMGLDTAERNMIDLFWDMYNAHDGVSAGYNIINFDLPYLYRRSFALGTPVPLLPSLARYRTYPTIDLMQVLYNWGAPKSLKWVCKRYGIENPLPDVDGSMVKDMDDDTLREYVENDVRMTHELFKKMKGIYF